MNIESIDFFYLSMPEVLPIADGSQDALIVRISAGGHVGWGECEASPLVSIASLVTPMSHGACRPVQESVLGQRLDDVADIARIGRLVRANSLDILQADHTYSGIDMALWDLLGRKLDAPVYALLQARADGRPPQNHAKTPYASMLFGATAQETLEKGRAARAKGYRAAKFGWAPYGTGSVQADADQVMAAREGLGDDGILLVDAGTVWIDDLDAAVQRLPALNEARALWLEEPFVSGALDEYRQLARQAGSVKLAGGEGSHNFYMAKHMIDYADIGFVQIDAGRIGGISVSKQVADYAAAKRVTYVNHTFTSHLALSASLQPYAHLEDDVICEYPVELKDLAYELTLDHVDLDANGQARAPEAPGLGLAINSEAIARYLVEVEISVGGELLYQTPSI